MATNNRRGRNNNPEGRNQYSGWMDTARERPATAAAAAAMAVGAGVFLWSRREQISSQLSELSDQVSQWSENMQSRSSERQLETAGGSPATMNSIGGLTDTSSPSAVGSTPRAGL